MKKNLIVFTFCLVSNTIILPKVGTEELYSNDVNQQILERTELSDYPDILKEGHADLFSGISKRLYEIQHIERQKEEEERQELAKENVTEAFQIIEPVTMYATTRVNFRTEPTTASEVIEVLSPNAPVVVTGVSGEWHSVEIGEKSGYVHASYLNNEEVAIVKQNRWNIELSNEEINLLAGIVWLESRGESSVGQEAVVEVVFNRLIAPQYPDSIYEVLSQRGQFSSWSRVAQASPGSKEFNSIQNVLAGNTSHTTAQTLYFSTSPRNSNISAQIGNHFFCED